MTYSRMPLTTWVKWTWSNNCQGIWTPFLCDLFVVCTVRNATAWFRSSFPTATQRPLSSLSLSLVWTAVALIRLPAIVETTFNTAGEQTCTSAWPSAWECVSTCSLVSPHLGHAHWLGLSEMFQVAEHTLQPTFYLWLSLSEDVSVVVPFP